MTVAQINLVLAELDAQFGTYDNTGFPWLECDEIAVIIFANNENVYPDKTMQVKFDNTNELLYLREGAYNESDTFIESRIVVAVNYSLITGIEMWRKQRMKSAYKYGRQV